MLFWSPNLPTARITVGSDLASQLPSISMKRGKALLLPISARASTARSHTHQSLSLVASISCATARSSLVWFRISMAARRMSWFSSLMRASTASTTRGPPILPRASAARVRTHQSLSAITSNRYLTDLEVPTTFRTSTAARRAYSFSSLSTSTRNFTVSG